MPQISTLGLCINNFTFYKIIGSYCRVLGRVPPVHRGAAAVRALLRIHVVQPAGRQEKVLQEAREENEPR